MIYNTIFMKFTRVDGKISFPDMEKEILTYWKTQHIFEESIRQREGKQEFIFYDGPPFPTGSPHYGTMFVSILKDLIPRYKTMRGYKVPRVWGWDCHGLPIETQAEKKLNITQKKDIEQEKGVQIFNDTCRNIVS